MTTELPTQYQPVEIETEITDLWNAANAFHADPDDPGEPYCIVIPPPNVTAALHLGHALNNTLQDVLIRYQRMLGRNTLWMPGTDHAGIATQTVVEKRVLDEQGKKRTDFKRDEFVAKIQAWKDEYEAQITHQLKEMGCSCDWDRQRFTMDEMCAKAVREAFFRLFKDGLIYRGKRLVNWDPATQTALADDEVENHDIDGHFWYLQYPLEDGSGHVTVATTRPETMLGDTAVAVNPTDPRAAELRGKNVRLPIVNRIIPIIEDDYVVPADPESSDEKAKYASGFLKVTPAHDPNDWDIGLRHDLAVINVMAPDGSISNQHGWEDVGEAEFVLGLDRYEAREAIVDWFRSNEMLEDVKPYRHTVGHSYRSHVPVEPYLSDQWYVRVTDDRLAGAALRAMAPDQRTTPSAPGSAGGRAWEGKLRFYPERYARTFETWHENIRDWCISRQLWWGHRIPVWSAGPQKISKTEKQEIIATQNIGDRTYVCLREDDPVLIAEIEAAGFERDPDVLDTWFSSALWPFSTMAWPDDNPLLETFNPGNLLCTAREIITLWVSRMVMSNLYFLDRLPFTDVFIHAMIQDGEGRKMSKSLGNGVDPLDIIHSHGADAMRFTLASMTTNTQDVRMPVEHDEETGRNTSPKFDIGRNFANKLWNAARFALTNLDPYKAGRLKSPRLSLADRWILSRLARTIESTNQTLDEYEFSTYAQGLYDFFWRDLCDWYIEAIKPTVRDSADQQFVLATCLGAALKLLHPAMPFITEKLWQRLCEVTGEEQGLLCRAPWPTTDELQIDDAAEQTFERVREVVNAIRQVRTQQKVPPRQQVPFSANADGALAETIAAHAELIGTLANVSLEGAGPDIEPPADAAATVLGEAKLFLHGLIDADAERTRLTKRLEELNKSIHTLEARLGNESYTSKAPEKLVQQTRDQLANAQRERDSIDAQIAALG